MKGSVGNAAKLQSLLRKHALAEVPAPPRWRDLPEGDPVALLVHAMLVWEAPLEGANRAFARLSAQLVDWNDLRVCLAEETEEIVGVRYPLVRERCLRLRETLNAIYKKHHRVDLQHLVSGGKRDARAYLESLPGLPPAVAARMLLLTAGSATMPIDERLRGRLVDAGVVPAEMTAAEVSAWVAKNLGSDRLVDAMHALQAFADEAPAPKTAARRGVKADREEPAGLKSPAKPAPKAATGSSVATGGASKKVSTTKGAAKAAGAAAVKSAKAGKSPKGGKA